MDAPAPVLVLGLLSLALGVVLPAIQNADVRAGMAVLLGLIVFAVGVLLALRLGGLL